jgi:ribosomal protein S18 acetylase RimI-like enzyme
MQHGYVQDVRSVFTLNDTGQLIMPTKEVQDCSTPTAMDAVEFVTLRRASSDDAGMLALIGAATFLEAFTWMLPGADILAHTTKNHTAEAYAAYLAAPDTRITLAVTGDDAPVGFAMLTAPELPSIETFAADIELKRIYLFSRFRSAPVVGQTGMRPGQALMDAAIADARALGRTRLLLGTHAGNERAIGFYRRNAFVEAGTRTFLVGTQVCSDLVFARSL